MRFSGQATTVKCFENNPLVRKVRLSAACVPAVSAIVSLHGGRPNLRMSLTGIGGGWQGQGAGGGWRGITALCFAGGQHCRDGLQERLEREGRAVPVPPPPEADEAA